VGTLIVANRPGNAIGWVFSAIALLAVLGALAEEYAGYAVRTRPGLLPGGVLAGWFSGWAWYPTVALALVFTPLLFPDGRPPSPPWRLVGWLTVAATTLFVALAAVQPTIELDDGHTVDNPIGVAGIVDPEDSVLNLILGVLVVAAALSLVVRFRRSRGAERLQLKWFTYAGAVLPVLLLGDLLPDALGNLLFTLGITFPPVAAGIAILRYRLYEIDRLINRTLVYGLLTALLAGVYAGLVLILGRLFGELGGRPPSWAVAGATLAVAALFQPARRRIQAAVDRRFNRRRYDAARTVEAFSTRLRDQVDLATLSAELLAVVDQTVQPTRTSLWLRPERP
jgi:MFS family permease